MLRLFYTKRFKKDLKVVLKRGKRETKIKDLIRDIATQRPLGHKYQNHKLRGTFSGRFECHVETDWLLIYKLDNHSVIFERTGTHSDLFK